MIFYNAKIVLVVQEEYVCTNDFPPVSVLAWTWKEVIYFGIIAIIDHWVSIYTCCTIIVCIAVPGCFNILHLVCTGHSFVCFLLICLLDICMSCFAFYHYSVQCFYIGMPTSVGPFPGTTNKFTYFCYFMITCYTTNSVH